MAEQLAGGERCGREPAGAAGFGFSTISKHLAGLKQAAIVGSEKRGRQVSCRLNVPCALRFMGCEGAALKAGLRQGCSKAGK